MKLVAPKIDQFEFTNYAILDFYSFTSKSTVLECQFFYGAIAYFRRSNIIVYNNRFICFNNVVSNGTILSQKGLEYIYRYWNLLLHSCRLPRLSDFLKIYFFSKRTFSNPPVTLLDGRIAGQIY